MITHPSWTLYQNPFENQKPHGIHVPLISMRIHAIAHICVDVIQHGVAICVTMGKKVTSHYLDEADVWSCSKLKTHWGKCYTWGSATRGIYTANFPHDIYMWKICSFAAVYFQKSHPCCRKKMCIECTQKLACIADLQFRFVVNISPFTSIGKTKSTIKFHCWRNCRCTAKAATVDFKHI